MKTIKVLAVLFLLFSSKSLFSQGMNNYYPIDSTDIKVVFDLMGIDIYKFPIKKTADSCKLVIKSYLYENHELKDSSIITRGFPEDCLYLFEKDFMLRTYIQKIDTTTFKFVFNFPQATFSSTTIFGNLKPGQYQTRAYTNFEPVAGKSIPFLIFYGYNKDNPKTSISCPGDAPIEKVAQWYDIVVAYTFEIEKM